MKPIKVCLHKKGAHMLERNEAGQWILDGKEIEEEQAITELFEAVQDLGYWCQVARDVLPTEDFEMVQEAYLYQEDGQELEKRVHPRVQVKWFSEQMELKLRENDHKGGWDNCTFQFLFQKLDEEVRELTTCISEEEAIKEAADVGNIAMMIADRARKVLTHR